MEKIREYSKDRVDPICQHFGICGGCKWQHYQYESQLKQKHKAVENALLRIGKIEVEDFQPILAAPATSFYRNKLEFSFSNKRWLTAEELNADISNLEDVLGFHKSGAFDKIVNIENCWLQPNPSNDIRNFVRTLAHKLELSFYDARAHEGFMRNMVIRVSSLGEVMLIFSFGANKKEVIQQFFTELLAAFPKITSLYYCINTKVNDFLLDLDMKLYHGEPFIKEQLGHVLFKIGPKSFFQTNTHQAKRLYDTVVEFADLKGHENVYDLYTGIGSIALYVAKFCKQVVGIEEVAPAIEDAKANASMNQVNNAQFYAGDVKTILTDKFATEHGKPDLLITDPPRAGMHANVVEMLLKLSAPKLIYVSCNPATQARDLAILKQKYKVEKVRPVDMFPHTHHIENVALLRLKDSLEEPA